MTALLELKATPFLDWRVGGQLLLLLPPDCLLPAVIYPARLSKVLPWRCRSQTPLILEGGGSDKKKKNPAQ